MALGLFLFGVVGGIGYNFYLVEPTATAETQPNETASSPEEVADLEFQEPLLPSETPAGSDEHAIQVQKIARTLEKDTGGSRAKLNSLATRVSKGDRFLLTGKLSQLLFALRSGPATVWRPHAG